MPPKATNRPTPIAVTEEPGVPSGFIIPMLRKLSFSVNILCCNCFVCKILNKPSKGDLGHIIYFGEMEKTISTPERMMRHPRSTMWKQQLLLLDGVCGVKPAENVWDVIWKSEFKWRCSCKSRFDWCQCVSTTRTVLPLGIWCKVSHRGDKMTGTVENSQSLLTWK